MGEHQLSVRLHGAPVADLVQTPEGKMKMTYLPEAKQPLSLSLPLSDVPYAHTACEAYFGGLLPESEAARKAIAKRHGVSANNSFSLLRAIGYDCAGAVSLHAPDDEVVPAEAFELKARVIDEAELEAHIRDLPRKPLFMDVEGLRLSLAGAQDKAAICLIDGQPALPVEGTPTTHILKPAFAGFEDIVLNEYLCLTLASAAGLSVPRIEMRQAGSIPYFLIERYDRKLLEGGRIARVHQEDFCQAMGILSSQKYQAEGGPSLRQCFELTMKLQVPALARTQLLNRVLFNTLVGNCDSHGKNFSLLHDAGARLSPAYDIVCTRHYPDLTSKMAMKIGSKYQADQLFARHWKAFGDEIGYTLPNIKKALLALHKALQRKLAQLRPDFPEAGALRILDAIEAHADGILNRFLMSEQYAQ